MRFYRCLYFEVSVTHCCSVAQDCRNVGGFFQIENNNNSRIVIVDFHLWTHTHFYMCLFSYTHTHTSRLFTASTHTRVLVEYASDVTLVCNVINVTKWRFSSTTHESKYANPNIFRNVWLFAKQMHISY